MPIDHFVINKIMNERLLGLLKDMFECMSLETHLVKLGVPHSVRFIVLT